MILGDCHFSNLKEKGFLMTFPVVTNNIQHFLLLPFFWIHLDFTYLCHVLLHHNLSSVVICNVECGVRCSITRIKCFWPSLQCLNSKSEC